MSSLEVALKLLPLFVTLLQLCEAQGEDTCLESVNVSCVEGVGRGLNNFTETRLIPMMEFTCNGTIVGWTVSGRVGQGTQPPMLQIWRRSSNTDEGEYYHKRGPAIPINLDAEGVECEESSMCNQTFQCQLSEAYQTTVQSEIDIVGIELPPLENQSFELFFTNGSNSQNVWYWQQGEVMTNTSLRIGSQDATVEDSVLLYLNISTDINECIINANVCDHICTDTTGSFECSCYDGHTLASDRRSCMDTDECVAGTHDCQQLCINVPMGGGFMCDCELGYLLNPDNHTCRDIDECANNSGGCAHRICSNIIGSFECGCRDGYQLDSDGRSCKDIDECKLGIHKCEQLCVNTDGGFSCECGPGYQLDSDGANCTDINECASNNGGCQHTCSNTEGSFECSCRKGFILGTDGLLCIDIDECVNETHGCEHACNNTEGSFQCSCYNGYRLTSDGRTCTDKNECLLGTHNCEQLCVNTIGNFSCECNPGYQIVPNGATCLDIDECESNNGGCQHICSNSDGSFTCRCENNYQLSKNGQSCNERTDLIAGAAVGGTFGILVVIILVVTLICVYITYLRRSKGKDIHVIIPSRKRHKISLPYVVENKSYSNTLPNTRGPKILVLNAPAPDVDKDRTNLEVYNSLFEEVTDLNGYSNGEGSPT